MYPLVEDMSDIYAHPLPRVYVIFLFAIEYSAKAQPPQHTTTGARALGRGRAYIFDMSSASGYMGAKYVHDFAPIFFGMSSASGYMLSLIHI